MDQSSIIAAGLIIGFIVFITIKGQLSQYLGVLGLGANAVSAPASSSTTSGVVNPGTVSIGNFGLGTGVPGSTPSTSTGVPLVAPLGTIPGVTPSSTTIPGVPLPAPTVPSLTLNDGTDATSYV
jgi:hypothetical protein